MKTITAFFSLCLLLLSSAFAIELSNAPSVSQRVTPAPQTSTIQSYHGAIKEAAKGVVNISTQKQIKGGTLPNHPILNDPFFRQFFGDMLRGVPKDKIERSLGSGVIISSDGYIITNNHVIDGADKIMVALPNNSREYQAKVIGKDPKSDIAVIKIDAKNLPFLHFANSNDVLVGDVVFAIGNPFGLGETVTQGIVSALNKSGIGINDYENFIQTDASINQGNSGGALIDSRGALVGINTAILSRSGDNTGIGFAIPSDMAKRVALALIDKGVVERGFLGVAIEDVKSEISSAYNGEKGAVVISVEPNSPAAKAGLRVWDLIMQVDNQAIKGANDLRNTIGTYPPDEDIKITYMRDKKVSTTTIRLANANTASNADGKHEVDGATVSNLDEKMRSSYRIPANINGVMIQSVRANSRADDAGLQEGDVILQVENTLLRNVSDFGKIMAQLKGKPKRIVVYRQGQIGSIVMQ
ncbi:MAG: Do family serine endopeptidase [Helicobacter sp.]|nr:Do family serine endopeptidase [Helicobacter sp.]